MAVYQVPIDSAQWSGLAGPTCQSARITTYMTAEDRTEVAWQDAHYAYIEAYNGRLRGGAVSGTLILTTDLETRETFGQSQLAGTLEGILLNYFGP